MILLAVVLTPIFILIGGTDSEGNVSAGAGTMALFVMFGGGGIIVVLVLIALVGAIFSVFSSRD